MSSAGTAYVDVEAKLDGFASAIEAAVSAIDTQTIDIEAVADVSDAQSEIDSIDGGTTETTVTADTSQAQEQISGLGDSINGLFDGSGGDPGQLGDFAEAAGLAGASSMSAATGGIAALGLGLGYAVSEASDAETTLAQLDQMVANVGANAGVTSPHLQALATDLQQTAGFSDEAVMSGASMVLMFQNVRNVAGQPIFDRVIKDSADLARSPVFNGDIAGAARTLGRAIDDPTAGMGRLRRAGIQLTEAQQEIITSLQESGDLEGAQAELLDVVEEKVNGLAAAYGDTLAGSLDRTKEKLGENAEEIGSIVLPVVNDLVGGLSDIVGGAYDAGYWLGQAFTGHLGDPQFIQGVGTVVGELPAALYATGDAGRDAADGADAFATSLSFLDDRTKAYLDGVYRVPDAERALREAFADVQTVLDNPTASADDLAVALERVAGATGNLGTATGDMSGAVDIAQFALLGLTGQGAEAEGQIDDLNATLDALPGQTDANVAAPGAVLANSQVENVTNALLGVPPSTVAYVGVSVNRAGFDQLVRDLEASEARRFTMQVSVNAPRHRAAGGPVEAGRPYIVGEERPELFVPDTAGTIIPEIPRTTRTPAVESTGGSGPSITVNVHGTATQADGQAVVDALRRWSQHNGPVPVKVSA